MFPFIEESSLLSMLKCHQVREQSKVIYCGWEANPPMLTSIRVSINKEGQLDPIEEKTIRRPETFFAGLDLSYGAVYTISVGLMKTTVHLEGPSFLIKQSVNLSEWVT